MFRALFLIVLTIVSRDAIAADQLTPADALAKAQAYVWDQQREDGSWRSEQYAVMRSGQSLTPFVLHTLLSIGTPLDSDHAAKSRRAVNFIVARLDAEGALGKADSEILEYPLYSTAYSVLAFNKFQQYHLLLGPSGNKHIQRMQGFLRDAQYKHASGFPKESPAFGGWGFDKAQQPGEPGHMDLAHTRRAMQAMSVVNQTLSRPADFQTIAADCQRFLAVVQKHPETLGIQPVVEGVDRPDEIPYDGGFYFSPVVLAANKGRFEEGGNYWRSYATATCDGILALLAAGVPKDDERVVAAVNWLRQHTNLDYPQGIPTGHPEPWGAALRFYHYAVRAEVYDALDFPAADKRDLAEKVAALQQPDGSFVNSASPLMKEDEPLLATALAVVALSHCTE